MGRSAGARAIISGLAAVGAAVLAAEVLAACADDSNASSGQVVNVLNEGAGTSETTSGSGPAAASEAAAQVVIDIANFQFSPAEVTIPVGTEVVWTNNDTDVHSIVSTGDLFAGSEIFSPGESYSVVFTEPGTYPYVCGVHPFMAATVVVE